MIYEKEFMVVVKSITRWRHHLKGARHRFLVYTDHNVLLYYCAPRLMLPKKAHRARDLSSYILKYVRVKGKENYLPEALSRNPVFLPSPEEIALCNTSTLIPESMLHSAEAATPACAILAATEVDPPQSNQLGTLAEQVIIAQTLAPKYKGIVALAAKNNGLGRRDTT